jgi:hypothetical protein
VDALPTVAGLRREFFLYTSVVEQRKVGSRRMESESCPEKRTNKTKTPHHKQEHINRADRYLPFLVLLADSAPVGMVLWTRLEGVTSVAAMTGSGGVTSVVSVTVFDPSGFVMVLLYVVVKVPSGLAV